MNKQKGRIIEEFSGYEEHIEDIQSLIVDHLQISIYASMNLVSLPRKEHFPSFHHQIQYPNN